MNNNRFTYKGYIGEFAYSSNERYNYYGTVIGIRDTIDFRADTLEQLQTEFELSIDDYLEFKEKHERNKKL